MQGTDGEFATMQRGTLDSIRPTLSTLAAFGSADCASVIEKELSTPMFLRDEVTRLFAEKVIPAQLARVVDLFHSVENSTAAARTAGAQRRTDSEGEHVMTTILARVYPDRMYQEATRQADTDGNAVNAAFKLAVLDAAQVREHYCGTLRVATPQPQSLTVSCGSSEYQIVGITPPADRDSAWHVRSYNGGSGTYGTWEVTPSTEAMFIGRVTCRVKWQ